MGFLDSLLKPNVEKMKAKRDRQGLIKALGHENDAAIRESAAQALGEIGDTNAVEPLIVTLRDQSPDVRAASARALAKIGDTRAVAPLIAAFRAKGEKEQVREDIVCALAEMGDERAIETLVAFLTNLNGYYLSHAFAASSIEAMLCFQPAIEALGKMGTPAAEALVAALKSSNSENAILIMGKTGNTRFIEPLIPILHGGDMLRSRAATDALDELGWRPDSLENEIAYKFAKNGGLELIRTLKDHQIDSGKRIQSIVRLGEIGDTRAIEPLIAAFKDVRVRNYAVEALGRIGVLAVEPLIAALKDEDASVRSSVAKALGKMDDARVVEPLIIALKDKDVSVRSSAAEALGKIGWQPDLNATGAIYWIAQYQWDKCVEIGKPAVESLIVALRNYEGDRRAVIDTLRKIGDERYIVPLISVLRSELMEEYQSMFSEEDGEVYEAGSAEDNRRNEEFIMRQEQVIEELGKIRDARAVEPLIAKLKQNKGKLMLHRASIEALAAIGLPAVMPLIGALKDSDKYLRSVAAEALGRIGDACAVEPLIAALNDSDAYVRKNVIEALKKLGYNS